MQAKLIQNPELVKQILIEVDEYVAEDNSPDPRDIPEEFFPPVIALRGEDGVHGIIAWKPFSENVTHLSLAIRPEYRGHRDNIELARMGVQACQNITQTVKFLMMVPVPYKDQLRFAQRVGFQREGVLKNSFRHNDVMVDQYLLGLTV